MTQLNRKGIYIVTALFVLAASPLLANGRQAYFNDFDGGLVVASGITDTLGGITSTESVQGYDGIGSSGNTFGGNFLRNTSGTPWGVPGSPTTLTLTGLPPHGSVDISFLLAIIDGWDGTEPGGGPGACTDCHPDIFTVTVDGVPVFSEAFGFNGPVFVPPLGVLLTESVPLGFNSDHDDAAYDMGLNPTFDNIPHSANSLTIEWVASGDGWQGGDDESWAIDNLEVILYSTFPDVPMSHWAWQFVETIFSEGLTSGYPDGTYRPDNPVTRGEMAVFIKKGIHGSTYTPPTPDGSHPFSDISGHWAEAWIEDLFDEGFTTGFPDGTYRPDNQVTRAEIAVFLKKAIHGSAYTSPTPDGSHPFSDIAGHWAEAWIEDLYDEGITTGFPDGTYRPENQVTRAEMAVFLVNAFNLALP